MVSAAGTIQDEIGFSLNGIYGHRSAGALVNGLSARTVLIVEDEWLVRMELVTGFEDENCAVLEAGSAEDALTILQGDAGVELLVTDIRLSGALTGWDVAAGAREIDPAIPVIYVSANPPAAELVVPGGVFIEKPALIAQVVDAARRLLG